MGVAPVNDDEFFTALLDAHTATTGAEDSYWEPKQMGDTWNVYAVGENSTLVAVALTKPDAEFLCAMHATLPDIVRRLKQALAEAEKADEDRDKREQLIAELMQRD